jgi:biotin synthase-like enzyme
LETDLDRYETQVRQNLTQHPDSVPINLLVPIPGTPFEKVAPPTESEFVRTIAVARIMMPKSVVRLSAGRTEMGEVLIEQKDLTLELLEETLLKLDKTRAQQISENLKKLAKPDAAKLIGDYLMRV